MDMNIDVDGVTTQLREISRFSERISSKAAGLRSSLSAAAPGFQSEKFASVEAAVRQASVAMEHAASSLQDVKAYVDNLVSIAEKFLSLKY